MEKLTNEDWQMIADEMRVEFISQKVKKVCERVYKQGLEDMFENDRSDSMIACLISDWMSSHDAESEREYICNMFPNLSDEDKRHAMSIAELLTCVVSWGKSETTQGAQT